MKTTFRRLQCGILAVAWLLAGCNSDVFIDRFLSAEPSVSLSETEKEVTVCFEADNWDILGVESLREGVAVSATDLARLIRESYRLSETRFHSGYDIVVIARPVAKDKNYFEVESALLHLGKVHKIAG